MRVLSEITGMRGFAAFYVLAYHVLVVYAMVGAVPDGQVFLLHYGWIGVDFFFVLSGFLLALPLLGRPESMRAPGFWRTYIAKRWWRIAPPYYLSIFVALALANQLNYLVEEPLDVVLHLTFLHSLNVDSIASIVGVYWTLASEFQFYLILPLFVVAMRHRSWPISLGLLGLLTLAWRAETYHGAGSPSWVSFTLPAFLLHFAFGILAARLHVAGYRPPAKASWAVPLVVLALIVVPLMGLGSGLHQGEHSLVSNILLRPILAMGFATVILLLTTQASGVQRALGSRPMVLLGDRSYSLYLIHLPVLILLTKVPALVAQGFWTYLLVGVTASIVAAALFFVLVERPSLAVREWFVSRRTPATTTARAPLLSERLRARPRATAN